MNERVPAIEESKQEMRHSLASLPIDEKIRILERLRDRALAIASSSLRRSFIGVGPAEIIGNKRTESRPE